MSREQHKPLNEKGFASIVIALVLIIVLALLTVGFAQLARREQQTALDKQLATQANDAAESGINDAYTDIQNGLITTSNSGGGKTCLNGNAVPSAAKTHEYDSANQIDSTHGVGYSCLLVNLIPPTLRTTLAPNSAWTTAFKVVGSDNSDRALRSFVVQWSSTDGHTAAAPSGLPPVGFSSGQWGKAPALIEFSITPLCVPSGAAPCPLSRTMLENNALTVYLHPSAAGTSVTYPATGGNPASTTNPYTSTPEGQMIQAYCANGTCKVTVNMTGGAGAVGGQTGEEYLIHVVDYYDNSDIELTSPRDASGPVYFANSQAVIDATGKARQVLKRLQAVVPIGKTNPPLPSYGLEARDLCKLINTTIDTLPDGSPGGTTSNTSGLPAPGDPNGACSLN